MILMRQPFIKSERDAFLKISTLFFISFSALLLIGTLSMAFANFELGVVLFVFGMVLVVGNETLSRRIAEPGYAGSGVPSFLPDLLKFAAVAYVFPLAVAIGISLLYGWSGRLSFVVFAGLAATGVKVLMVTAKLFLKN